MFIFIRVNEGSPLGCESVSLIWFYAIILSIIDYILVEKHWLLHVEYKNRSIFIRFVRLNIIDKSITNLVLEYHPTRQDFFSARPSGQSRESAVPEASKCFPYKVSNNAVRRLVCYADCWALAELLHNSLGASLESGNGVVGFAYVEAPYGFFL